MSPFTRIRIVAGREVREAARSKAMRITTLVLFLAALALTVVPRIVGDGGSERIALGVDRQVPTMLRTEIERVAGVVDDAPDLEISLRTVADAARATAAVRDGELDAAIVRSDPTSEELTVVLRDDSGSASEAVAEEAARRADLRRSLAAQGVAGPDADELLDRPGPAFEVLATGGEDGRELVAFLVSLTLYLALLVAGQMLAQGVAIEKATRTAEVLLSVVRPGQLLAGKVLGIGAVVLVQLLVIATPVVGGAVGGGGLDLPASAPADVVAGLGWFVLGYAVYACAFAALGALVDRQEQVGGAVAPLTMLLVGGYLVGITAQDDPDGGLVTWASYFPFTTPLVMPVRVANGAVGASEVAIAVGLALATAGVLVRVGATVYRRAIIRGGRRLKLREVLAG